MTVEVDPSARIQVRQPGQLMHPGCCTVCGYGGADREYVDPAIWFDYEGQIYFCTDCTIQLGETIGMSTPQEFAHLKALYEENAARLKAQEDELNDLRGLRDAVISVTSASISSDPGNATNHSDEEPTEPELIPEPTVSEPLNDGENEQSEPTEPSEGSGSDDAARTTSSNGRREPRPRPLV